VIDAFDALSSHRLLDRLIRGRLWIGIVAFALIGIVALQLFMLKLNSGIGRALESQSRLQRQNASLSIENSELAAGDRVEEQAKKLGMTLVPEEALRFRASHARSDVSRAEHALSTPVAPAPAEAPSAEQEVSSGAPPGTVETTTATTSESSAGETTSGEGEAQTQPASSGESIAAATTTEEPQGTTAPVEGVTADGGTQAAPAG
jgi:cell division protein FtsL